MPLQWVQPVLANSTAGLRSCYAVLLMLQVEFNYEMRLRCSLAFWS